MIRMHSAVITVKDIAVVNTDVVADVEAMDVAINIYNVTKNVMCKSMTFFCDYLKT